MKTSDAGIALIKRFEGCMLDAYPDPATGGDPWTIGYGHTGPEVHDGMSISEVEAEALLRKDLARFEACIGACVHVETTQGQFDALVSLAYNVGCWNVQASTLVKLLNAGNADADQFLRWNKAAGKVMAGLTKRREAERELFLS